MTVLKDINKFIRDNIDQFDQAEFLPLFSPAEQDKIIDIIAQKAKPFCDVELGTEVCAWHKVRESLALSEKLIVDVPGGVKVWRVSGDTTLHFPIYKATRSFDWARLVSSGNKLTDGWRITGVRYWEPVQEDLFEIERIDDRSATRPVEEMASLVLDAFPGFRNGTDVNGADLVDFVASYLSQKGAL